MSPDSVSSVVWLVLLLPATTSTPSPPHATSTLLFSSGAPAHDLRNCSCPVAVGQCDEALANSLCRCRTVLRSSLSPAGLREPGPLSVWVKEGWVLEELLDRSTVGHLQLSFCGAEPLDRRYLAVRGLQTLRIHASAPRAPYPDQELSVCPPAGPLAGLDSLTVLDLAVLNGLSALKAYRVPALPQHFHHLDLPAAMLALPHRLLVTFVY